MTTPSDKQPGKDNSFSSFTIGLALGVMGALLFGTEEGRSIVKKVMNAVPDKYKLPPIDLTRSAPKTPVIPVEETPHHTTFAYTSPFDNTLSNEAPPPPAPHVRPTLSEPFHPNS